MKKGMNHYLGIRAIILILLPCIIFGQKSSYLISNTIMNKDTTRYDKEEKDEFHDNKIQRAYFHIMIIPNLKSVKEIQETLENDASYRFALDEIAKVFSEKGYVVKDFVETIKISKEKYNTRPGIIIDDPFLLLIQNSPADIIIYTDFSIDTLEEDRQVSLRVVVKDKYTAEIYASTPLLRSTKRRLQDIYSLISEALNKNSALDSFVLQLDKSLLNLLEKGRKIDLELESKGITFDRNLLSEKSFAALINSWINENSIQNHFIGLSEVAYKSEVIIPVGREVECMKHKKNGQ